MAHHAKAVSPPEESDTNSSYQEDPRRTRSEPPRSPKQSVEEEALPSGLPAQGSAAPEPDVEMNPELPAVPLAPAEEATPVPLPLPSMEGCLNKAVLTSQ